MKTLGCTDNVKSWTGFSFDQLLIETRSWSGWSRLVRGAAKPLVLKTTVASLYIIPRLKRRLSEELL